jgi:hypothetical protein
MSSPLFPNTTNTRTWPYGTVKRVQVMEVITKVGASVAAIICAEIVEQEKPEAFILMMRPELVGHTRKGDQGTITFRPGGPTLGYWDYQGAEG